MSEERLRKDINRLKQLTNGCIPEFHQDIEDVLDRFEQLKEVIEEVREYVNTKLIDVNLTYGIDNEFREEYDDLLQILDKAAKENK